LNRGLLATLLAGKDEGEEEKGEGEEKVNAALKQIRVWYAQATSA
jgi:hypothetical protein